MLTYGAMLIFSVSFPRGERVMLEFLFVVDYISEVHSFTYKMTKCPPKGTSARENNGYI